MKKIILTLLLVMLTSCAPASAPTLAPDSVTSTFAAPTELPSPTPTSTFTPTPLPTSTFTATAIPFVESLKATVTADLLTCRYGPGPEYLYLFAFKKGANINLIGRVEGSDWVLVENEPQRCWIKEKFVTIQGDPQTLRSMYPDGFTLIVSPYYGPTAVLSAERKGDEVTVTWMDVPVSPGKYETPDMFPYIIEVWRCENGQIIFDPIPSRLPFITFIDQAGCSIPSHGRVYVQEKHGYAGPAEIPWPVR
ncbi:MAG: hypothetical protein HZB50_16300 [Chloroflexi bacterium]|nr:hypothetical protein [Chloroflexota bacterium]